MQNYLFVAAVLVCVASKKIQSLKEEADGDVPPLPKHNGLHAMNKLMARISDGTRSHWQMNDKQNIWELSGLLEGDIMEHKITTRNALADKSSRWPEAVVPYNISDQFNESEKDIIHGSIEEIHQKTCVKFRPYKKTDEDYIVINRDTPGCWSYHGRRGGGQVVNLSYNCINHGTVIHELLHALGFLHQHVVANRDNYIKIHWENINPNKAHNFKKRDKFQLTDYGVPYDYESIMHYRAHAFSVNDKPTMTPLKEGAKIGQIKGLSEYDVIKLNKMYNCK